MVENIKMSLMLRNSTVVKFDLHFCLNEIFINNVKVINENLLPYSLRQSQYYLKQWLMSRMMPSNTYHYILMIPIIFHKGTERRPYAQFAMSLATNGLSIADHYWFNPKNDISFCYEGRNIDFKKIKWNEVDVWKNDSWSTDLNQFLFNDILLSCSDNPLPNFKNPIFTTNGEKEKMWYKTNNKWIMEKRLSREQIEKEEKCFLFFKNKGFLTPKCKIIHYDVIDKYQFYPYTIKEGFDVIQKECLTSRNYQLTPLNWYINESCEDDIRGVFEQAKKNIQIDSKILKNFENVLIEYKTMFHYKQFDVSNFGFLVDANNNATPTVWSNVCVYEKNWINTTVELDSTCNDNPLFVKDLQF